jgi:hypothetical protein|tara:strand:- start:6707 stop:7876 length:1170 start_codon:yes stop_codon:yes gene_type:complete
MNDPAEDHRHQRGREKADEIRGYAFQSWKYPETVGNDSYQDDISFNSHATSEYAKIRMSNLAPMTHEPYMMFEFMRVDNDNYGEATSQYVGERAAEVWNGTLMGGAGNVAMTAAAGGDALVGGLVNSLVAVEEDGLYGAAKKKAAETFNKIKGWAQSIGTLVKRKYMGSICLYMPVGIEINDQMIYNDDSRKMGAFAETLFSDDYADIFNPTTLTSPTALTAAGFLAGKIPGAGGGIMGALVGAGLGTVAQNEVQRGSGKIANPNEITMYNSTALRTFTFSYTILPDNAHESEQATGLIKMFRMAAHARKDNKMLVTVPDHVIVSFHGAGAAKTEMIQLPPCVIESVNVSYNPNNTSFFKQNNAPVEIGLSIGLKEMAPIYQDDVEAGY